MSYKRKEIFECDPITRTTRVWHEIDRGESWAVETRVDVTPVIEANQAEYAMTGESTRWGKPGEVWAKVASIPSVEYWAAVRAGKFNPDDDKSLLSWIQDRDHLKFRTRQGRLI